MSLLACRLMPGASVTVALFGLGCSALVTPDPSLLDPDAAEVTRFDGGVSDGAVVRDGGGATCAGGCDDDVPCTVDRCEAGRCVHPIDDDACPTDQRCSPLLGCVPLLCSTPEECDDTVFCNGVEQCEPTTGGTGCVAGAPPVCDDEAGCTDDRCDDLEDTCVYEASGRCADDFDCTSDVCDPALASDRTGCVHSPDNELCESGYCFTGGSCDPELGCIDGVARDCADVNPCTADLCNESAMRCDHPPLDADNDGYAAMSVAVGDVDVLCEGRDCDDDNDTVFPGAPEVCDGLDNNCRDGVDEGCADAPDDCGSALPIVLRDGGRGAVTGNFAPLSDDFSPSPFFCPSTSGGRDAVYYLDIPAGISDVQVDTIGSSVDTLLSIAYSCPASALETICTDDFDPRVGNASRIWIHRAASFTTTRVYFLVDTSTPSAAGTYTVNVVLRSAAPDSCVSLGGTPPLDISGGGLVIGALDGSIGGQRGSCHALGDLTPEALFRVDGTAARPMTFRAYSSVYVPDLYLRSGTCSSGTELGCVIGGGSGLFSATLNVTPSSTGTNYVFLEGGDDAGAYVVIYEP